MSKFTLLHETPDHFVVHNGRASFHIAKKGIAEPTADKIRSFANGGKTVAGDITQSENKKNMAKIDANIEAAKHYADGGQTPYEAGIEAKEKNTRATPTQSPDEAQIEAAEQNRRAQPPKDYSQENDPELKDKENPLELAEGGKLTIEDRKHIAPKNFAGPYRSYPIEDASHARNALARVSQHGSPELKAQVRAKVHAKYPGIEQSHSDGGEIQQDPQPTPDPQAPVLPGAESFQEGFRKKTHANNYAEGGQVHTANGKYHFHFYDGAVVPSQLDKEEGAGPQQPSALDKYVGGEPANGTELDQYVNMADGGLPGDASTDSDKLAQAASDIQAGLNSQTSPASSQDAPPDQTPTVPQTQQIPVVPKPLPPTPDQQPNMLSDFDKNLALQKQGIEQGAAAQSAGYKAAAQAIGENQLQQKAMVDEYKVHSDQITAQNEQLFNAVASSKVDPNHFWNNKSTGGKIMATIGVILGGAASGMAGGSGQNQGLMKLNSQIQDDIESQKNDQSNKMNLYKMGLEKYKDAQSAEQFALLQSNALLQGTLQKIAAQTGSQQVNANAQQMIGQIGVQNAGLRSELAMKQAALGAMNQPQQANAGVDPNKMRLLINAGVIPKEEVPTAMKEYSDYTKLSDTLDHTDDVFNKASQTANYTERLANSMPGGSMLPTVRDASKQYEAITDAWLGNITKDTEGRVTPADIQLMKASLPKAGDNPQLIQQKLSNIKDMIRQKYAFPTLQSYRLLGPNNAVSTPAATRQKRFSESAPK